MKPKHRNKRLGLFLICGILLILGVTLLLKALQDNKQFFKHPSDVVSAAYIQGPRAIKIGGLVAVNSVRQGQGLETRFDVIDFEDWDTKLQPLDVRYTGVLPDLFREGQGVVITGTLAANGIFEASEVLAKHDENYMPKMPEKTNYDK